MMHFKNTKGFTLLELVIVMAIVAILASFIVSAASIARKRGVSAKAKVGIASLETALSLYESDLGDYPDTTDIKVVVEKLEGPDEDPYWEGPYMEFKEGDLKDGAFVDPWGEPYNYVKTPSWGNKSSINIWSNGPDGNDDSSDGEPYGDDVYNW